MFVTNDYLTSRHVDANREFRFFCALVIIAYWMLRLSCFFFLLNYFATALSPALSIFFISADVLLMWISSTDSVSWSKVSVLTSGELTTIFLRQRISMSTRGVTKRRRIWRRQSAKLATYARFSNQLIVLDPENSSKVGNVPTNIQKRNWNIRSSVTSASFAQNAERQEVIETFRCMFRHIRSFRKQSLIFVSFRAFILSADAVLLRRRLMSTSLIIWRRRVKSQGEFRSRLLKR